MKQKKCSLKNKKSNLSFLKKGFKKSNPDSLKDEDGIYVFGAREHNLKNIKVFIPRNKITLITGLSGSGKSTLAFDTLYAEGQRRYMESLSVYARYFIDKMKRPKVDFISGLSPSIAINQKTTSLNPRSTVGTVTEIYDFLRLLYAKVGEVKCPRHNQLLKSQTAEEIAGDIFQSRKSDPLLILSPIAIGQKGEFVKEISQCLSSGFDQARIDGKWQDLAKIHKLNKRKDHDIDILIDRILWSSSDLPRIQRAVDQALNFSGTFVKIENQNGFKKSYSLKYSCPECDYNFLKIEPKLFSFNSPQGACPSCNGTGLNSVEEFFKDEEVEEPLSLCSECQGLRLNKEALQVKVKNKNIHQVASMNLLDLKKFLESLSFTGLKKKITEKIKEPFLDHLSFLLDLNLDYLSLNRSLSSLSGGEAQRVRLASQLASSVIGVLYVLDEPSIGLHPKDHGRILNAIKKIRDRGNTVVIVEHDEESIYQADKVIDLGPGAGAKGGFLIAEGTVSDIKKNKKSLTGDYLSKRKSIPLYQSQYSGKEDYLYLKGLRVHNLKNLNIKIPLSRLIGVSGVSGSGKSSLVNETLYPLIYNAINKSDLPVGDFSEVKGLEKIHRVLQINQKPIGRTPRSNPATYVGLFSMIRTLFSCLPEARMRGYRAGFFSFNVPGGRCENCKGAGSIKLEMRFLPDVFTVCDTCSGKKYNPEILNIYYKGKNIYEVLNMNVDEAEIFFKNHPYIHHRLKFLKDLGLAYIQLGQSSLSLSGGEAQRIKLSRELAKKNKSHTLYLLDEPTTGLHLHDIAQLIQILRQLVDQGHTVLVIEHHLDILKSCDYLIDLGPKGGAYGGHLLASGKPQQVAKNKKSLTGHYLSPYFS